MSGGPLETTVERIDATKVKLTVTVDAAEVDKVISSVYTEAAKKIRIPGFRNGKAPRPVLDTHLGRDAVLADAQEEIISTAYARALSDEDIRPIESPDTGEVDAVVEGEPYTFTAEIVVRPELGISSADDFSVSVPPAKSSDREIDAQVDYMRDRFATLETVDKAIESEDFALISFVSTIGGEEYEGNRVDMYLYELGRGMMPAEFDEALVGAKAGEQVVASFMIPDTSSNAEFVGKEARFEITVDEVKAKVLPDLDDEFAKAVGGFETFEAYREDIRDTLDKSKAAGHARQVEDAVRNAIGERLDGEVPQGLIRTRANNMVEDFFETLEQRGMSVEQYMEMTGTDAGQIRADIEVEAARRLAVDFALEALFRAKGMDISEDDLTEAIREIAGGDADQVERMRSQLRDAGAIPVVKEQIMHRKALKWLMDNAEVVEEEPGAKEEGAEAAKKPAAKKASAKKPAAKKASAKKKADEAEKE